ncbi:metallo-hydrolase/oxidoreductase superfamily protein [Artemisia annua]|uniref:Metallo-hydrolase/oxidoreductase superfamily protein n=1 Tax=Artemisia annua TaxID=35608 RepID=A0A2U1L2X2_ARTAN|nr:metallo-hydrolase/oxidoreductase superfamily protein [Artemisia annua]
MFLLGAQKGEQVSPDQPELIFIGTGTSEGIPRVSCLTNPLKKCKVCSKAVEPGNKNRRLNTSVLIRYPRPSGTCNILIDAGKFFYQSALRWFPTYGIRTLDAVVITHSHADAIGGLDDLRDWTNNVQPRIPIYVAERDFEVMKKTHYYLVDTSVVTPGAAVSKLQFDIIHEKPFIVHDLKITPLPVWHGRNYRSLGFRFGNVCYISDVSGIPEETYPLLEDCDLLIMRLLIKTVYHVDAYISFDSRLWKKYGKSSQKEPFSQITPLPVWHGRNYRSLGFRFGNVCYISDVSGIPEETYPLLEDCDLLIMDALRPDRSSSTHFGLPKALEEVRKIKPKRTLFTGMMHLMDHEIVNEGLLKLKESEGMMHLMDHEIVNEGLLKLKESEGLDYQEDMFSSTNEISSSASLHSLPSVQKGDQVSPDQPELIFIGTGSSEGIPRVSCLTNPLKKCKVCSKAVEPGNKNRRLNTSVLIRYPRPSGTCKILIDAGKFFYQSALRWFPTYGIRTLDAVVITHSHADAIGGLDDLRDWTNNVQPHIPIYVAERDFEVMKKTHYYLVDTSVVTPGTAVSELQFAIIQEKPFTVHDLKVQLHFLDTLEQLFNITPLPVWHGRDYRSLGFRFGNVCYISDVSEIPEETYPLLEDCDLLIMDALRPDRSSSTHFGLPKVEFHELFSFGVSINTLYHVGALMLVLTLGFGRSTKNQAKKNPFHSKEILLDLLSVINVDMMHLMDHEIVNEGLLKLKESEGLDVQLSYDGLRVPIDL